MLELLSYGEYNHVYFSVTCFLKTTRLSVIVFSHSFFVSYFEKNIRLHHLSEVEKYWLQLHRFKTLNNINVNNFSLGDPCCEINFGKTKSLKIAQSFCAKVFKDHVSQAICYLASLKACTSKVSSWKTFFNSTKWLKAYETGYPFFINNVLKPERVVCSKCQHRSSIKMTSLKLATSGQLFFHANHRIPDCETTTKYFW